MTAQEDKIATCPLHDCKPECSSHVMQEGRNEKLTLPNGDVITYCIPKMFECKVFCPKCKADMSGYEKDASTRRELGRGCVGINATEDDAREAALKMWDEACADICLKLFTRAVETGA